MDKKKTLLIAGFWLGVWILVSPWILGFAQIELALWNNVFIGVILAFMFLWLLLGEW